MRTVSVVMSCYNEKDAYLKQAIESILNQSYKNIEFIIVVDDPTNESLIEIIEHYGSLDDRIKVIRNESNIGLALSLNKGIDVSGGEYIARMDADDISLPDRLKKQVDYLDDHSDCALVCGNFIKIDECDNEIGTNLKVPRNDSALVKLLHYQCAVAHPTVMIRKTDLCSAGMYNNYRTSQDYDLWLRMAKKGYSMHYDRTPLIKYRYHKESTGSTKKNIQFISCRYARKMMASDKIFDESDYKRYLEEKQADSAYMKCIDGYYDGLKTKNVGKLLKSSLMNGDCRNELVGILISRVYLETLN